MPANMSQHKTRFAGMARSYARSKYPWGAPEVSTLGVQKNGYVPSLALKK